MDFWALLALYAKNIHYFPITNNFSLHRPPALPLGLAIELAQKFILRNQTKRHPDLAFSFYYILNFLVDILSRVLPQVTADKLLKSFQESFSL